MDCLTLSNAFFLTASYVLQFRKFFVLEGKDILNAKELPKNQLQIFAQETLCNA